MSDLQNLVEALAAKARREHYYCEDPWYSCPKATDGCVNDESGDECNCGADEHNSEVEALLARLIEEIRWIDGTA